MTAGPTMTTEETLELAAKFDYARKGKMIHGIDIQLSYQEMDAARDALRLSAQADVQTRVFSCLCGYGEEPCPDANGKLLCDRSTVQADMRAATIEALEKIAGRREYTKEDLDNAENYKRSEGCWDVDEYLADRALSMPFIPDDQRATEDMTLARNVREATLKECEQIARGPLYAEIYNGCEGHNWSRDSDYGRGRHAAADAILALSDAKQSEGK